MMSLSRYRNLFDEFRLLDDLFFEPLFGSTANINTIPQSKGFPKYDQYNKDDGSVVLEFALAGYKASELSVSVDGLSLIVSAVKAQNQQDGEQKIQGRSSKSFERVFTAGENLNLENIKASYEDGLLTIEIPPKMEEANKSKIKKIDIVTAKALKA